MEKMKRQRVSSIVGSSAVFISLSPSVKSVPRAVISFSKDGVPLDVHNSMLVKITGIFFVFFFVRPNFSVTFYLSIIGKMI